MNTGHGAATRLAAVRILDAVLSRPAGQVEDWPEEETLEPRDRGFARHLAYGVLRWLNALEWLAAQLVQRPLKARDRDVELLILIGLFQLWRGDTAAHAAVHATVEAARGLGKPWAAGLINAVLRHFQRRQEQLLNALSGAPEHYAHPAWLQESLRNDWPEHWQAIMAANNQAPPLWLRVNRLRIGHGAYREMLTAAGLTSRSLESAPEAVLAAPAVAVDALPGFQDGLVSVQDAAAQLAANFVDATAGQSVLDACAAPGGKTCHLLERTPGIDLTALDVDARRVGLIQENLKRLGLSCRVLRGDATRPDGWWDGQPFDRILLDAPCSATGIIRRHPEIKWLRTPREVQRSVRRQATLLEALWPLLKPGGILVYATCSVMRCENSQQIVDFLSRHPEARCMDTGQRGAEASPGCQVLPGEQDMDGFYYARLGKPA